MPCPVALDAEGPWQDVFCAYNCIFVEQACKPPKLHAYMKFPKEIIIRK